MALYPMHWCQQRHRTMLSYCQMQLALPNQSYLPNLLYPMALELEKQLPLWQLK